MKRGQTPIYAGQSLKGKHDPPAPLSRSKTSRRRREASLVQGKLFECYGYTILVGCRAFFVYALGHQVPKVAEAG